MTRPRSIRPASIAVGATHGPELPFVGCGGCARYGAAPLQLRARAAAHLLVGGGSPRRRNLPCADGCTPGPLCKRNVQFSAATVHLTRGLPARAGTDLAPPGLNEPHRPGSLARSSLPINTPATAPFFWHGCRGTAPAAWVTAHAHDPEPSSRWRRDRPHTAPAAARPLRHTRVSGGRLRLLAICPPAPLRRPCQASQRDLHRQCTVCVAPGQDPARARALRSRSAPHGSDIPGIDRLRLLRALGEVSRARRDARGCPT
jgi:hypothetical protein